MVAVATDVAFQFPMIGAPTSPLILPASLPAVKERRAVLGLEFGLPGRLPMQAYSGGGNPGKEYFHLALDYRYRAAPEISSCKTTTTR